MWKKLNMSEPLITSLPKHANAMSILAEHRYFPEWAFLNHIQLSFVHDENKIGWLDFHKPNSRHYFRMVRTEYLSRQTALTNQLNIVDFILNAIDQSSYVCLMLDTYHIPAYKYNYHTQHIYHDMFVYGYDLRNKTFSAADFFNVNYGKETVSFDELSEAFNSSHPIGFQYDNFTGVQLLRVDEADSYRFDRRYCIERLQDYVGSYRTNDRFRFFEETYEAVFGISAYETQIGNIVHNDSESNELLCLKALHIVYDHKKAMSFGVRYLTLNDHIEDKSLSQAFADNEKAAHAARHHYMKYLMARDPAWKHKALEVHRGIIASEKELFGLLIADLERTCNRS